MAVRTARTLPECWGHRGASAAFPENTLASFKRAIEDGAEGIESDVHVSRDGVVVMFHDPSLERTTDGKGAIKDQDWHGPEGMEHVRTRKEPRQAIPTFKETVALLMKPENHHVKFNVDIKVSNDPTRLFTLMAETLRAHDRWETVLAPRILLGLWHPRFLGPARRLLPTCARAHIGLSAAIARKYFWKDCEAFSMLFDSLVSADGERFRNECKAAGKKICVWTVNESMHMAEAVRWGVDAILTDHTKTWLDMRCSLQADYDQQISRYGRLFLWTTARFYAPLVAARQKFVHVMLERMGGPLDGLNAGSAGDAAAEVIEGAHVDVVVPAPPSVRASA